jgi:hypothetical protein
MPSRVRPPSLFCRRRSSAEDVEMFTGQEFPNPDVTSVTPGTGIRSTPAGRDGRQQPSGLGPHPNGAPPLSTSSRRGRGSRMSRNMGVILLALISACSSTVLASAQATSSQPDIANSTPAAPSAYVYVSTSAGQIAAYSAARNGALTAVPGRLSRPP